MKGKNTTKLDNNDLELLVKWCTKKFGYSKYIKGKPTIIFDIDLEKLDYLGLYDWDKNLITINPINNIRGICGIVIHEYSHYLQDGDRYVLLGDGVLYEENHFETKADKRMDKYKDRLYLWFKENKGKKVKLKDIK
jgi:Zn-dependent peptidase ImmA (M78 family)